MATSQQHDHQYRITKASDYPCITPVQEYSTGHITLVQFDHNNGCTQESLFLLADSQCNREL